MQRPSYLLKYLFDWELFDVILGGKSALDSKFFVGSMFNADQVNNFLKGYGLDPNNPVTRAELFGNFQEALQFIKRYFLKEGNPEGLDLKIPNSLYMITDIGDLFLMATGNLENKSREEMLWAEVTLKVMHTILHVDKDLRTNYFNVIQTQIFDRFYKYIHRYDGNLFLSEGGDSETERIPLVEFETKSKKARDSVIIKLLHKAENVAEELFDRIGLRIITENRLDTLRVVKFLLEKNIVIPHNIKPSRSVNTLIDLPKFRERYKVLVRSALKGELPEDEFMRTVEQSLAECLPQGEFDVERNAHRAQTYHSIQFTCRQLIKYKNPFLAEFNELRRMAKDVGEDNNELANKLLTLDVSLIARDVRFFYPYEVQITDLESHRQNTEGDASHADYKKAQVKSAMKRVFSSMLKYKEINI